MKVNFCNWSNLEDIQIKHIVKEQSDEEKVSDDQIKNPRKVNQNLNIAAKINDLSNKLEKENTFDRYLSYVSLNLEKMM